MVGLHRCCYICQFFSWRACEWYNISGGSDYALKILGHHMVDEVLCHFFAVLGARPKINIVNCLGPP